MRTWTDLHGVQWSDVDVEQALTNKAGIDALISLDRNVASVQPAPPKSTKEQIEKVAGDVRLLVRALRFTQGTAKRQAILKKLRQLQAFIDQRCAAFNAKPKHAHLSAFFGPCVRSNSAGAAHQCVFSFWSALSWICRSGTVGRSR